MGNRAKKVIEVNVNVNENKTANKINTHMKMQAAKGGRKKEAGSRLAGVRRGGRGSASRCARVE